MTQQYLRALSVVIGNENEAYDFSQLHVRFEVKNADVQTLKTASITIYNLSSDTAKSIFSQEFTKLQISAGYQGNMALIFSGDITMCRSGRESAIESFVNIQAQDGDKAFNWARSNWTLQKGYLPDDVYKRLLQDLAQYGITQGYKPPFTQNPSVDALTCYGMTRDQLRNLADAQGCRWSIENNQLNFLPLQSVYPGTVPLVTPDSGLIGIPEQTIDGIIIKCLLNPLVRAGGQINLGNAQVTQLMLTQKYQQPESVPTLAGAGAYKVCQCIHTGDNRGNTWYTTNLCTAVDGTAPLTSRANVQVPDNG
ncbi:phage protein [Dyella mobilis]|uniref:Phage protein D n=1 Tax=Dyella mobilis TaxID=1849582 RepID=A0ABS2KL95_9GAMM|nr:hypothetical protein [Dyella mobilis]MBM7131547.1 hypothetical protein [Dyella mobilis]GLQ96482.1 hypothetical protein GCM10007863_09000 [Dyella mobilis]